MDCATLPATLSYVEVPRGILDRLTERVDPGVTVAPQTGCSLTTDWWTARIDALEIECCDYGIDAALVGLTHKVHSALDKGLLEDPQPEEAGLILRLHLANVDGTLGRLLERSATVTGTDRYAT